MVVPVLFERIHSTFIIVVNTIEDCLKKKRRKKILVFLGKLVFFSYFELFCLSLSS
uniref:Uncharacterized protein n=1 Tax=Anguilla anguilla TaxID=7936 RepID=A0A0E9XH80_ANGAN